ncbi:MAG: twin-arginine translocase subunit TatC [Planctomycetes bacterium]|nr:twin-arginine translocase subunit TatC [Planctomycetota bacterium]
MSKDPRNIDPDDFFAETRMSFGDHIEDLRVHLWRAIKGFFFACILGFFLGPYVLHFIAKPVEEQLQAFYDRRVEDVKRKAIEGNDTDIRKANEASDWFQTAHPAKQFQMLAQGKFNEANEFEKPEANEDIPVVKLWTRNINPVEVAIANYKAQQTIGKRPALSTLNVQEAFMVYLKVSMVTGFVLGSPWIFFQIWAFVAAGLYPHEKRYVHVYLPLSLGLFLFGVLICEFFVMPKAVEALLWFNEWLGLEPEMRLNEWLGFAIMMPVVFGLSFQTPLIMLFLNRISIMSVDSYREKRRLIWFLMAVFAAVITPSTDPASMLFLWVPMCLLFELGIWLCLMSPTPSPEALDESEEEESLIEV